MVIEIALGIVLAVIILWALPLMIAGGALLIGLAVIVAVVAVTIYNWKSVIAVAFAFAVIALSIGLPYGVFTLLTSRYGWLKAAVDGKPPYHTLRMLPVRLALTGPLVFLLVALGLGIGLGLGAAYDIGEGWLRGL